MSAIAVSGGEYYGATSFGHSQNNNYNFQHQTINGCQNETQLQIDSPSDTNTENKLNHANGKYNINGGSFYGSMTVGDGNTMNHIHFHISDPNVITRIDPNTIAQALQQVSNGQVTNYPSAPTNCSENKTIQNSRKRALSITHEHSDNEPKNKKRKLNEFDENVCEFDENDIIEDKQEIPCEFDKKYDNINDIDGVAKNNESSISTNKQILTDFVSEKPE
eukprot:79324_1